MKRIMLCTLLCLILGGCSGNSYQDMRDIESFEIVQTLGVDYENGLYTVTAATGTGSSGQVTVLTSKSVTPARAMQKMQNCFLLKSFI